MTTCPRFKPAAIAVLLCLCSGNLATAQPSNDECANPVNINCGSSATVDSTTATENVTDPGYSCHFDGPGTQAFGTIWFTFTATDTSARIGSCTSTGAADDTELAVYSGTCGALTELGCSEDDCGAGGLLSRVCVNGLTIGNVYYIQVGGYANGDRGPITVTVECPCPVLPETCETAQPLTLPTGPINVDNGDALSSTTPPFGTCNSGAATAVQNDIWYTITTGPDDCILTMTLDTSYDALAILYTGADCNSLSEQDCFDDDINATHFFNASANTTYWIRIGDWGTSEGGGDTNFSLTCPAELPIGACCSTVDGGCFETDQVDCLASDGTYQGDGTTCATGPCRTACCLPDSTCVNVTGQVTGFPELDCEDPIELGGLGGTWFGPIESCDTTGCPPPNDDCATAEPITVPASLTFNNDNAAPGADGSTGECNTTGITEVQNDVWYTYTTGADPCELLIDLNVDFDYDAILIVYSGTDCNSLTEVTCLDDDSPGSTSVTAAANTTYWIRVGDWGASEGGGNTQLDINCIAACSTCPGDANGDAFINGADIQEFTNCYLAAAPDCGCSDVNRDGLVDDLDTTLFVDLLLNDTGLCDNLCHPTSNGQLPGLDNAFLSNGVDFEAADNFRASANDDITSVRWWGVYDSDLCPDADDAFVITYYNDNNNRPGTVKAGPFNVVASREETGRLLLGFAPEFVYEASHAPVAVSAGECVWLSIKTPDSPGGCIWFWSLGTSGDGVLASSDTPSTWPASSRQAGDHAWCLDIALDVNPCPAATGSCCLPGEICNDTTEAACAGIWTYDQLCVNTVCIDVPTDDCASAPMLDCGQTVTFDNSAATTDLTDPGYSCHFDGPGTQGTGTMWYRFQASDTSARLRTCDGLDSDTIIGVYDGTCGAFTEIGCSEDDCGPSGLLSQVCVDGLTIGNIYYVQIATYDAFAQGPITISLECPCPSVPNDECVNAIAVTCPSTLTFDNTNATPATVDDAPSPNDPVPSCSLNGNAAQATMWYTLVGNGQNVTIQSCNTPNEEASNADTTLSVWTGPDCATLAEVACSEDACFGGDVEQQGGIPEMWMSSVTFLAENGQVYWIMWSQAFADRGNIQMDISCAP